jgi:hypothetical protein
MRFFIYTLLIYGLIASNSLLAQKNLCVTNYHRFKRDVFRTGDRIRFKTLDGKATYSGNIETVSDSMLHIFKEIVTVDENGEQRTIVRDAFPIREIRLVYRHNMNRGFAHLAKTTSGFLMAGGTWLGLIKLGEYRQASRNGGAKFTWKTIVLPAALLTSGAIVMASSKTKYRIGRRWQIQVLPSLD